MYLYGNFLHKTKKQSCFLELKDVRSVTRHHKLKKKFRYEGKSLLDPVLCLIIQKLRIYTQNLFSFWSTSWWVLVVHYFFLSSMLPILNKPFFIIVVPGTLVRAKLKLESRRTLKLSIALPGSLLYILLTLLRKRASSNQTWGQVIWLTRDYGRISCVPFERSVSDKWFEVIIFSLK